MLIYTDSRQTECTREMRYQFMHSVYSIFRIYFLNIYLPYFTNNNNNNTKVIIRKRMCIRPDKNKPKRPPLKPREGSYKKTNAYSLKPCFQQILTVVVVLILIVIHSIFNVGAIAVYNNPILNILLAVHYLIFVIMTYTYIQITRSDPVDDYVVKPEQYARMARRLQKQYRTEHFQRGMNSNSSSISMNPLNDYKPCNLCRARVHFKSYHCKRCKRCTQNFDHHCVYLNTCIGGKNYELFFRIVLFFWLYLLNLIFQNIWLFVVVNDGNDQLIPFVKSKWVMIGIIVFSFAFFLMVSTLCVFHFYMSLCLDLTTLQFIQSSQSQTRKLSSVSTQNPNTPQFKLKNKEKQKASWNDLKRNSEKYNDSKVDKIVIRSTSTKKNKQIKESINLDGDPQNGQGKIQYQRNQNTNNKNNADASDSATDLIKTSPLFNNLM